MDTCWPLMNAPVKLAAEEAHVWAVPLDHIGPADELHNILSPEERRRAAQFQTDDLRRRFCIARVALRTLLGRYLSLAPAAIELSTAASGKPQLAHQQTSSGLRFNVAHSYELALAAFARHCELGVDVEQLRMVSHAVQIARRYFHQAEAKRILAASPAVRDEAFLRCWTAKEAILKATGLGLSGSLTTFQVPINEHVGRWIDLPRESSAAMPKRFWLEPLRPANEYVGAIALSGCQRRLRCFTTRL